MASLFDVASELGVNALVSAGANVHEVRDDGHTPFTSAFWKGWYVAAGTLAMRGADVDHAVDGETALWRALRSYSLEGVMTALAARANVEFRVGDVTPLQWASTTVVGGFRQLTLLTLSRALVDYGADIEATYSGLTCLQLAVLTRCDAGAQLLLELGAWGGAANARGVTALHQLARRPNALIGGVWRAGGSVFAANVDGETPIEIAARLCPSSFRQMVDLPEAGRRWPPVDPQKVANAHDVREMRRCREMRLDTLCARVVRRTGQVERLPPTMAEWVAGRDV